MPNNDDVHELNLKLQDSTMTTEMDDLFDRIWAAYPETHGWLLIAVTKAGYARQDEVVVGNLMLKAEAVDIFERYGIPCYDGIDSILVIGDQTLLDLDELDWRVTDNGVDKD